MSEGDVCYLCLRITREEVLKMAHLIWPDGQTAREIASEASDIIRETYLRNPTLLCGKSSRAIVAGLFYILGIEHAAPVTQRRLERLEVTSQSIRKSYRFLLDNLPRLRDRKEEISNRLKDERLRWLHEDYVAKRYEG